MHVLLKPNVTPPEHINLSYLGTNYRVFLSTESVRCFSCGEYGHISRACKKQGTDDIDKNETNPLNPPPTFVHNPSNRKKSDPKHPPKVSKPPLGDADRAGPSGVRASAGSGGLRVLLGPPVPGPDMPRRCRGMSPLEAPPVLVRGSVYRPLVPVRALLGLRPGRVAQLVRAARRGLRGPRLLRRFWPPGLLRRLRPLPLSPLPPLPHPSHHSPSSSQPSASLQSTHPPRNPFVPSGDRHHLLLDSFLKLSLRGNHRLNLLPHL